jgi:hypothetical protein
MTASPWISSAQACGVSSWNFSVRPLRRILERFRVRRKGTLLEGVTIVEDLNELEKAVLQAMCKQAPSEASALAAQISSATVHKRRILVRDSTRILMFSHRVNY